ncbi:endoglucanase 24-like isoform X2 [Tripterygium wilfordii]|uniref:endoglucanase 24-like isoform X2 n=1 Tax=Tripterygium wilfordii TaxID=458696 RepID=UPI0018F80163|nr:endoglucanase 24-like isoform X2 [Tripterygium wilfordii]
MEGKVSAEDRKSKKGWIWWLLVLVFGASVVAAGVLTILKQFHHNKRDSVSDRPADIVKKYADALEIALNFFDVQKSGMLVNNKIAWRGDSGLHDGREEGLDLTKGLYDAGDLIKFGYPMAFTATMLSWAILEYGDQMNAVKQLGHAQDSLKWITDFLINAHPSTNVLYVQKYYNSTGYGDELLWAATWLYHATGDLSYLRYVTEENGKAFANWGNPTWFSWDDKHAGTQVLLSRVGFFGMKGISGEENIDLQLYQKASEHILCGLLPDSPTATSSRTESGLIWVEKWNSLQHPVASAFLAVLFSDYMITTRTETLYCSGKLYKPADLREFAISQADYVLGNNPMKMSYLVGYGSDYPQFVHHRGSSIPIDANTGCADGFIWLDSVTPNPNVAIGALVGGPFLNETYIDSRNNSMQGEPTTYNSALVVALLSGLTASSSVVQSFLH